MKKLIKKVKDEMDSFSLSPKTISELINGIQRLQKQSSPIVEEICEDDFEVLKLSRLLISKFYNEPNNKFIQITGGDWKEENISFSLIRFWINDLEINRIIAYKVLGLGGNAGFEVVKRRDFLRFIYDEIKNVIGHLKIKFETSKGKTIIEDVSLQIQERRKNEIKNSLPPFKGFVERDGWKAFWRNGVVKSNNTKNCSEEIGKSQFIAFLKGREAKYEVKNHVFREVPEGAGFCDFVVVNHLGQKFAFETKMWNGEKYFQKGIIQLDEYLKHEGLEEGYYIIFDKRIRKKSIKTLITTPNGKTIHVIQIDIARIPPTNSV